MLLTVPLGTKLSMVMASRENLLLLLTHQTLKHRCQGPWSCSAGFLESDNREVDRAPAIATHGVELFDRQVISLIRGPVSHRHLSVHTQEEAQLARLSESDRERRTGPSW